MAELTLTAHQRGDLPATEMITGRLGYVHDFFLGFDYELVDELPDDPGRDLVVIADNRDIKSKLERLGRHDGKVVAAAAPSDARLRPERLGGGGALPPNLIALFASNNELDDERAISVPLGVRIKHADHCQRARERDGDRNGLLYVNFSVSSPDRPIYRPSHIRHHLAERFQAERWAHVDIGNLPRGLDRQLQLAYYENMRRHLFALSPEGIGPDCYRHWECLYLGAIPIMRAGRAMSSFSDLPILFTEDYNEIDENYLQAQLESFGRRRFEMERLTRSFYRRRFLDCVATLSNPRFLCWGFRGTQDERFLDRLEARSLA